MMQKVCGTSDLESVREVRGTGSEQSAVTAQLVIDGLGLRRIHSDERSSDESAVGEAGARRSALDAQAMLRRANRERRLECWAVEVLTALGERGRAVRDAERRAGEALRTMTDDEGLSVREAVEWCGSGVKREITRLRRLDGDQQNGTREPRIG